MCSELDATEKQDLKQVLKLEILKASKNRYKYGDDGWEKVVVSVIVRRIKDKLKKHYRDTYRIQYENTLRLGEEEDTKKDYTVLAQATEPKINDFFVIEAVEKFYKRATEGDLKYTLSQWELECLEILIFLYRNECTLDKRDIMECMGEDPQNTAACNTFGSKYARFCNKMKRFAGEIKS